MVTPTTLLRSCLIALAAAGATARSQEEAGAIPAPRPLFDGKTLDGWTKRGGGGTYRVEDGEIVGRSGSYPNAFLCTDEAFGDFELELEFRVDDGLNSGIQIRSNPNAKGTVHGYQVEIDPSKRAWSGGIFDESRRGWLDDLK
ncbi:MAG: 3-keto-disaccharide hydrolase, partial [Planctomycetota bacterium]